MNFRRDRSLLDYGRVQGAIGALTRNRKLFARRHAAGEYLDVGCGPKIREGFYGIDHAWRPGIAACWDITRGLPIADAAAGGVFTEHCVEHIAFRDFVRLADEFRRVLTPGAVLRVVVPDGELYARKYLAGEPMPYAADASIDGFSSPFMAINRVFLCHGHRFIYDFATLREVLSRAGFRDVSKVAFGCGRDPRLLIDSEERAVESLYVEAER